MTTVKIVVFKNSGKLQQIIKTTTTKPTYNNPEIT